MLKIAICEDNEIFVEIIKNNLKTMLNVPYKLDSFLSGREFLKALSENVCQYNLVFLDIELEEEVSYGDVAWNFPRSIRYGSGYDPAG